jgi:hypothetical protein
MSTIKQQTSVHCPLHQAADRLAEVFRKHGDASGENARLTMWVDARIPGTPTALRLERSVGVTIQREIRVGEMVPTYVVRWEPSEPGPFPTFEGTLSVHGEDDYNSFTLAIEGAYEPPGGVVGAAFDGIIGARVAGACARNLLAQIAGEIEAAFAKDEAEKREEVRALGAS